MASATWRQYRAIIQQGYITVDLDFVLENGDEWTDFKTAYEQYKLYKSTGMNAKIQWREVTFDSLKESEMEVLL